MFGISGFARNVLLILAGIALLGGGLYRFQLKTAEDATLICELGFRNQMSEARVSQEKAFKSAVEAYEREAELSALRLAEMEGVADDLLSEINEMGVSCPIPDDLIDRLSGIQ